MNIKFIFKSDCFFHHKCHKVIGLYPKTILQSRIFYLMIGQEETASFSSTNKDTNLGFSLP